MKRTQIRKRSGSRFRDLQRPRTECESNNWESNSTYFDLYSISFEHLELPELRATSSADKTMLFCVLRV